MSYLARKKIWQFQKEKTRVLCTASEQRCNRIPAGANREARRKPINKQVTFYLTEEQLEILKAVVRIQDIRKSMDCGEIVTYRFAVLGLLLNNEALNRKQTVIR